MKQGLPSSLQEVFDTWAPAFPACAACVFTPDEIFYSTSGLALSGEHMVPVDEHTAFDLASLTKALAAAPALFRCVETGLMDLRDPPTSLLPWTTEPLHSYLKRVTLEQLLRHAAGLPAYAPFFETALTPEDMLRALGRLIPQGEPGTGFLYSDIGYIILGHHLTETLGCPWTDWALEHLFEPAGVGFSFWDTKRGNPLAPNWEPGKKPGTVHDENARILGPHCAQAGLYGSLADVTHWLRRLWKIHQGDSGGPLTTGSLRMMWSPVHPSDAFTHGFDRPSREGFTTAGDTVDRKSTVGHLGFSGTAFWLHPPTGTGGVLLTNRVHLGRHAAMDTLRSFRAAFFAQGWKINR